ncbi:transposase [Microtetraspora malaysiensis]|uniref:transposase n=1 Tax=Microtetraspora malaysiensis TaxID=161358 RepID=UPI0009FD4F3B|nr:transposase [Microtetraspora malaysiensis]
MSPPLPDDHQGLGRQRPQNHPHRTRCRARHRCGSRSPRPRDQGIYSFPRRWAVERIFGWLMFHRRLARNYEVLPARSEAVIHLAIIDLDLMARHLTDESTPTWRGV